MRELIYRDEAVMAISGLLKQAKARSMSVFEINRLYDSIDVVKRVPVVESKAGQWLRDGGAYKCSACGYDTKTATNYCPDCGSKNTVEKARSRKRENH